MSCQPRMAMTTAVSLGQAADQICLERDGASGSSISRLSSPEISRSVLVLVVVAMAAHLLTQALEDAAGQLGHFRRLDAAGPGRVHRELGDDPARAAAQHDDPVAQAHRLTHVV